MELTIMRSASQMQVGDKFLAEDGGTYSVIGWDTYYGDKPRVITGRSQTGSVRSFRGIEFYQIVS